MSAAQIKVWPKHFSDGRESVESGPHSGRPAKSRASENVERVWAAINKDQRLTVRELEADLGIPKTTMPNILTQGLGMKRVVATLVVWFLLLEQEEHCAAVANDFIQTTTNEPDFLKKVIALKETEASLPPVQCFLYLVSSTNVSLSGYFMADLVIDIISCNLAELAYWFK